MPCIEMQGILRIAHDITGGPHESRKVDSQKIEMSDGPNCRPNKAPQTQTDREDMHDGKENLIQIEWQTKEQVKC